MTRGEEGGSRATIIEDFKDENKHASFNLSNGYRRRKLEGTAHKMGMTCRSELDPVDRAAISPLGRGNEGDEPVP